MRILVISDTHGDTDKAEKAIRDNMDVDLILHLGDYFRDAQRLSQIFPQKKFEYIYGNSDFMIGEIPGEKLLEFHGKRIFVTHGHRYSVKWNLDRLHQKAQDMKLDMLLFGHTHVPDVVRKNGYVLLNPGSITDPRSDVDESYAIIDLDENLFDARVCYV